ncbi:MAG TPA: hypothetical protein G4N94_13955 [Caldilineae bacterium]|nr:hypothetical protein [Caldilineae bacterium]
MTSTINEEDGAFYGTKIATYVTDALDRPWQLSTIQFDFNLPERFDLRCVGPDDDQHRPHMIHRTLLASPAKATRASWRKALRRAVRFSRSASSAGWRRWIEKNDADCALKTAVEDTDDQSQN